MKHTHGWLSTAAAVLVAASLTACVDGVSPTPRAAAVHISFAGAPYDEQTIAIGETIQLTAAVVDEAGDEMDAESVTWRTTEPGIAQVDGNGSVLGVGAGTAYIIAAHAVGEDSARVNVAAPIDGPVECAAGSGPSLALGETRVIEGAAATAICLPGSARGSEYELTVVNLGSSASSRLQVRIEGSGLTTVGGGPSPIRVAPEREDFHHRLRHDVSLRLEPRLRAGIDVGALEAPSFQVGLGDALSFNVETGSSNGCSADAIDRRGGRVRAVSQRAIIVADTLNPSGGFTDADYAEFGRMFDEDAWPLITETFGTPSDIDRNSKVYVFFTRAVNERPENASTLRGLYVGGFFFNRDLFPTSGDGACAGSNVAEMFYMLVPDPNQEVRVELPSGDTVPAKRFTRADVFASTRSVLVHEFQHLVNDSRRLHVNHAAEWEETWLNEGLSHIAEELMFYRASGLRPESNLSGDSFGSAAARDAFELFQLDNLERLASYFRDPAGNSLMGLDVLATRGATWYFLRYAADRQASEATFWRRLVTDAREAGLDNLEAALGEDPRAWIRDWSTAAYLDDTELSSDPRYAVASWNLRSLYPAVTKLWPPLFYEVYPLAVKRLANRADELSLRGAGAAYYRAGVAAGETAGVRVTLGDLLPPPSRLQVVVTRVK